MVRPLRLIDHFRAALNLIVKVRLSAMFLLWKLVFIQMQKKKQTIFHTKSPALSLAFIMRFITTGKCTIVVISRFNPMDQFARYNLSVDFFFCWWSAGWKPAWLKKSVALPRIFIKLPDFRLLAHFLFQVGPRSLMLSESYKTDLFVALISLSMSCSCFRSLRRHLLALPKEST